MNKLNILVTGCEGFIGSALCNRLHEHNLFGIEDRSRYGFTDISSHVDELFLKDLQDIDTLPLPKIDIVFHMAAQTAVTRSFTSPKRDFYTNAVGTFELALWAKRTGVSKFIYSSTNKVYGNLLDKNSPITDDQPLAPKTPYGVSKATGGMVVRELLPDVGYDFRQSCIYGDNQVGSVDQGWLGYIRKLIRTNRPVTCFGDGNQVRDMLHVNDLLDVYQLAVSDNIPPDSYVIGGGIDNALSFKSAVALLKGKISTFAPERENDQKYFVSDNSKLRKIAKWKPTTDVTAWLDTYK